MANNEGLLGFGWWPVEECVCGGFIYAYCTHTDKYHVFDDELNEVARFGDELEAMNYTPSN